MNRTTRKTLIVLLGILEVVFFSWAVASNRPRRSSELAAFARYQLAPTTQNRESFLKEQEISNQEIKARKVLGYSLLLANVVLIYLIAKRGAVPS